MKVKSLSHARLLATPWTAAKQAPLSMGFSRQEYWSRCHFLLQRIFQTQGLNPSLPHCRQMLYPLSHGGLILAEESACNVGDLGLIHELGTFPGEGKGYPLQYSGLEKIHEVTKSRT